MLGSVNGVLNESPGVVVTEGDPYGTSVWTTQINIRGFVTGRDTQQIGTTIDGLPNGGSSYGGGSLANRYIDTLDLETVEISQGTADISSRSNEALGGTLNFLTSDPLDAQRVRFVVGAGQHEASKYYVRYDTGLLNNHTHRCGWGAGARLPMSEYSIMPTAGSEALPVAAPVSLPVPSSDTVRTTPALG